MEYKTKKKKLSLHWETSNTMNLLANPFTHAQMMEPLSQTQQIENNGGFTTRRET